MTSKAKNIILGVAALACALPAWSQPTFRDDAPIFPSSGVWWSANDGAGRWGLVIEAQEGEGFPDGQIAVTVFSFESANTQNQAWYTSARGYAFNANWREDGFIGDLQLDLVRSANGTCLLCEDGVNEGMETASDVAEDAHLLFTDSNNAIFTVGNVGHQLVKAQWGDGVNSSFDELFTRPMQFQFEANTTFSDSAQFRIIDFVLPSFGEQDVVFNGTTGWNVYDFTARGELDRGGNVSSIEADFQIIANPESHEFFLNMTYGGFNAVLKMFSYSRNLHEARAVSSIVPQQLGEVLNANALMISVPSMNIFSDPGAAPYPFRSFGE